jgi:2-aminoadipate transaminase
MDQLFADRIQDVPRSFIREILTVALRPDVISFAGGLPNRLLFPVDEIREVTNQVLLESAGEVLQYGASEGDLGLREWISKRYREKQGLDIAPERILITSGSQQGLDLLGKVLINEGDALVMESPGYLGAIQAFSVYQPDFQSVEVDEKGMDIGQLELALSKHSPKLVYTVSNFQNPSGISYPEDNKHAVAGALSGFKTLLIDDDPYGELRFLGRATTPFYTLLPGQTVILGSFSKVVVPGLRLGWMVAPSSLLSKLLVAKQATDLHTSLLPQRIMSTYLSRYSLDQHIATIIEHYGHQRDAMIAAIERYFPQEVGITHPDGGMFLWARLPEPLLAMEVFEKAVLENVVFVPGDPFYIDPKSVSTLRLNFSCVDEATIEEGIKRLGRVLHAMLPES